MIVSRPIDCMLILLQKDGARFPNSMMRLQKVTSLHMSILRIKAPHGVVVSDSLDLRYTFTRIH